MSITTMHDGRVVLHQADCRDALRSLADNSIDSVVTDPPYALVSIQKRFGKPGSAPAKDVYGRGAAGFMGKQWDTGEVAFSEEFWAEVLRVLKPGGHVVAFSGTRTYHRMAVAIEDAGFEIRDQLGWVYGSGFPKSHDVSKAIDKSAGFWRGKAGAVKDETVGQVAKGTEYERTNKGDPITDAARDWQGWGTALKPAWEPICLARKPLIGTVAENVLEHGTGALNIDGCRVGDDLVGWGGARGGSDDESQSQGRNYRLGAGEARPVLGRWPANIVHDGSDEVLAAFPDSAGSGPARTLKRGKRDGEGWGMADEPGELRDAGTGSAARFFYCAKASRKDRDEGLADFDTKTVDVLAGHRSRRMEEVKRPDGAPPATGKNTHPTVKPVSLCQWLCRLVTPPGGTILDPFMGSGSTGKGAILEGFKFVGIEREDEYMPIATARIQWAVDEVNRPLKASATKVKAPANDNDSGDLFSFGHAASSTEAA